MAERFEMICTRCGATYERLRSQQGREIARSRFCSNACRHAAMQSGSELACERCGTRFYRKATEIMARSFCSRACYDAARAPARTSYPKKGGRHEHRIVAEAMIGRPLREGEVVHHVDGDRHNNEPSNLVVMTQSEHAREHFSGSTRSSSVRKNMSRAAKAAWERRRVAGGPLS